MPLFEYHCRTCDRLCPEEFFVTWRDAPRRRPCPCGGEQARLVGLPVLDTPSIRERNEVPGHVLWEGTAWEDADMTNPYLDEDHPGHFSNNTGHRVYST